MLTVPADGPLNVTRTQEGDTPRHMGPARAPRGFLASNCFLACRRCEAKSQLAGSQLRRYTHLSPGQVLRATPPSPTSSVLQTTLNHDSNIVLAFRSISTHLPGLPCLVNTTTRLPLTPANAKPVPGIRVVGTV
ncbi:hypothetical protein NHX12_029362 [Muraenolepis orangiensis]|uniref:Uncharacterized protein n=1 Tax=Muraenolepis orangiensis TaxID=630683 RepID=A0A9Q0EHP3_9TELE|nr:hypothetical protein NHX12_029362 [Muraenolepis orangiensis]